MRPQQVKFYPAVPGTVLRFPSRFLVVYRNQNETKLTWYQLARLCLSH